MRRNNKQYNHQAKLQGKFDSRMNKYLSKENQKHNDEIIRINEERRKKIEREQAGIEPPVKNQEKGGEFKILAVVVLCILLILFCTYRILSSKIEQETTTKEVL